MIEANDKKYEMTSIRADPLYDQFKASIDIVKDFIREHDLIIYGGTAIDFALRLKGDCIYPDDLLAIPDLDFYSPDPVHQAYDLSNRLYAAGFEKTRAIRAIHVTTMKVDIGDKHFVADIGYAPKAVFDLMPTVIYDGMRVLHPDFQRIDTHSALSFPFDNPPQEAIFARWRKDISRFAKMDAAYPIQVESTVSLKPIVIDISYTQWVLHGMAAYSLLYRDFLRLVPEGDDGVIPASFTLTDSTLTFSGLDRVEFVHFDPHQIVYTHQLSNCTSYAKVLDKIPQRLVCKGATSRNVTIVVYSSAHRMLCISPVYIDGKRYKCVGVQYLLQYFASCALLGKFIDGDDSRRGVYWRLYMSILRMLRLASGRVDTSVEDGTLNKSIWVPNVYVYGDENTNESRQVAIHMDRMATGEATEPIVLPSNYHPHRGKPAPVFDYNSSPFYTKDGRELQS